MPAFATRALIFIGVLLAAVFVFAQFLRRTSMFYPSRYPLGNWDTAGFAPAPKDVWFQASDSVRLNGWIFEATDKNAPLIVWCHGNGGNICERAPAAAEIARRGVSVFLFDWRGYGRSAGSPTEDNLYKDASAAYRFATMQLGVPPERIVMYGESLGGPYAAYVASRNQTRAVIIENSFPSLADLGNTLYHPIPLGWCAPFAMTTARWLNQAKVPVLVMHGRRDRVIPFALGRKLYDDLHVPKRMLVSDVADHDEISATDPERYYESVTSFARNPGGS